jgi:hypothetical protein
VDNEYVSFIRPRTELCSHITVENIEKLIIYENVAHMLLILSQWMFPLQT